MPKSRYYKILGLPNTASEEDVRKKYRLLAMKYHPDKNPTDSAQERFIEITEAYEILTGKRPFKSDVSINLKTEQQDKEERVKAAQQRYRDQLLREHLENERYYQTLISGRRWKTIRFSAAFGALLSLFLILDYFLPHHLEQDEVTHYKRNVTSQSGMGSIGLVKTRKDNYYWLSGINYTLYGEVRKVYVETSWIFHNPIALHAQSKFGYHHYKVRFNFYSLSWLLIILFLIPLFTVWYKRKEVSFTFFYMLSYYGINALMLIYLVTGNRWAHIVTLGFI